MAMIIDKKNDRIHPPSAGQLPPTDHFHDLLSSLLLAYRKELARSGRRGNRRIIAQCAAEIHERKKARSKVPAFYDPELRTLRRGPAALETVSSDYLLDLEEVAAAAESYLIAFTPLAPMAQMVRAKLESMITKLRSSGPIIPTMSDPENQDPEH